MLLRKSTIQYYLLFFYYKLRIFIDCTEGRFRLYLSELIHLIGAITKTPLEMPERNKIQTIETIWGKFRFIGDLCGYLIMNPSFERQDMEYFVTLMRRAIEKKENILFLDIGANVGLYSVGMSKYVNNNHMVTHAFEPYPVYHRLLLENIKTNKIKNIMVHHIALGDKNRTIKTTGFTASGDTVAKTIVPLTIRTLDSVLSKKDIKQFDRIFIKIDIEGHEEEALRGSVKFLKCGKPILFMIEDCVNPSIIDYLQAHDFRFIKKITPYDSFWEKN